MATPNFAVTRRPSLEILLEKEQEITYTCLFCRALNLHPSQFSSPEVEQLLRLGENERQT